MTARDSMTDRDTPKGVCHVTSRLYNRDATLTCHALSRNVTGSGVMPCP